MSAKPEKNNDDTAKGRYDPMLGYACDIEVMIGATFSAYHDQYDARQERELAWIAENPDHPDYSTLAADWLKQELDRIDRRGTDPAGRLSRAISTGKVRGDPKQFAVFMAVAAFIRQHRRWPKRSEIVIAGVSERTRDNVFKKIGEKFNVELDDRVRWVNPQ